VDTHRSLHLWWVHLWWVSICSSLGRIGDPRAVEALVTALDDKVSHVRQATVEALGKTGDARAVEALTAALEDENSSVRHAAAWALERLGWRPDVSQAAAAYWIINADAGKCVAIGSLAVKPLVTALGDEDKHVRQAAATALLEIYGSGKIEDKQKRNCLAKSNG